MAPKVLVVVLLLISVLLLGYVDCDKRRPLLRKPAGSSGTGCYFIVLKEKTNQEEMQQVMHTVSKLADDSAIYAQVYRVVKTFTAKLSPYSLEIVRRLPAVDYVEEETFAVGAQVNPPWHLDRLDQVGVDLDDLYSPIGDGSGVDVYILDSGINFDHEEFENRAKFPGKDPTDEYITRHAINQELEQGRDCHGHGTHVASLCGGKTFGSAKKVNLFSVRVLDCFNEGAWSVILEGLDYVMELASKSRRPSLASMSLSGSYEQVVDSAVRNLVSSGVHIVVAAGNGGADSCSKTPASSSSVITVGGTRQGDGLYLLGVGSNFGRCVDILAPGERILAAGHRCKNCSRILSGTSMSTPLVSGLSAIMLQKQPLLSPSALKAKLVANSVKGAINYAGIPNKFADNTANRLATIEGPCGVKHFIDDGSGTFRSPNFPNGYPPNLNCLWEIGGKDLEVVINLTFVNLEPPHDMVRVYDGCCDDHSSLVRTFTGYLNATDFHFRSTGDIVCVRLTTDGTVSGLGFTGSFVKFYTGTNLKVPDVSKPKFSSGAVDVQSHMLVAPRQARDHITDLMSRGYKLTWISSYRVGPEMIPYFDYVASNSSNVDTKAYIELKSAAELNQTIQDMEREGYYVRYLIDRIRGKNPEEPSYSVIFERRDPIHETLVFLRDTFDQYKRRLEEMAQGRYRLISHAFCSIKGQIEVTSVFTRDKRIPLNIKSPEYPVWQVSNNLTFHEFTDVTLNTSSQLFIPIVVEVYKLDGIGQSLFSAVYEKQTEVTHGVWFRWALNTTAARDLVTLETGKSWDVYISTGYTFLGKTEHFVQFTRKSRRI